MIPNIITSLIQIIHHLTNCTVPSLPLPRVGACSCTGVLGIGKVCEVTEGYQWMTCGRWLRGLGVI